MHDVQLRVQHSSCISLYFSQPIFLTDTFNPFTGLCVDLVSSHHTTAPRLLLTLWSWQCMLSLCRSPPTPPCPAKVLCIPGMILICNLSLFYFFFYISLSVQPISALQTKHWDWKWHDCLPLKRNQAFDESCSLFSLPFFCPVSPISAVADRTSENNWNDEEVFLIRRPVWPPTATAGTHNAGVLLIDRDLVWELPSSDRRFTSDTESLKRITSMMLHFPSAC